MEKNALELVVLEEGNNANLSPLSACCVLTFAFMI